MKKRETMQIRISKEEKEELVKASKEADISMSRIMVIGGIKEAKRILKQIEKGQ